MGTPRPFHALRIHVQSTVARNPRVEKFECFPVSVLEISRIKNKSLLGSNARISRFLLSELGAAYPQVAAEGGVFCVSVAFITTLRTSATANVFEARSITLWLAFRVFSISPSRGFHVYQSPACNLEVHTGMVAGSSRCHRTLRVSHIRPISVPRFWSSECLIQT